MYAFDFVREFWWMQNLQSRPGTRKKFYIELEAKKFSLWKQGVQITFTQGKDCKGRRKRNVSALQESLDKGKWSETSDKQVSDKIKQVKG